MKVIFDDGKEIEFDENEVALHHRERIFKKDGVWYITKIINKDFAKWLDETKPMIIEEKKIPEKLEEFDIQGLEVSGYSMTQAEYLLEDGIKENREIINLILDYLKSKGE